MTMADTNEDLNQLDTLFAEARHSRPGMPESLRTRVLADAMSMQAEQKGHGAMLQQPARQALGARVLRNCQQFWRAVGGWPAMGGMVAACGAGLWIGLVPPDFLPDPVEILTTPSQTEALPYESYDLTALLDEDTQ